MAKTYAKKARGGRGGKWEAVTKQTQAEGSLLYL